MRKVLCYILFPIGALFLGCADSDSPSLTPPPQPETPSASEPIRLFDDFTNGWLEWEPGFVDYPAGDSEQFHLVSRSEVLPKEISETGHGLRMAGTNRSDDLFMYLTKELSPAHGLEPNRTYELTMEVHFASNAPSGCVGIGGPPGESVYLKAGGFGTEPQRVVRDDSWRLDADTGNQSEGSQNVRVLSTIANGRPCDVPVPNEYVPLIRSLDPPIEVTSDSTGRLWLLLGTDSGFEGRTDLYYLDVTVTLTPVDL